MSPPLTLTPPVVRFLPAPTPADRGRLVEALASLLIARRRKRLSADDQGDVVAQAAADAQPGDQGGGAAGGTGR
jgi:hypothetical protein